MYRFGDIAVSAQTHKGVIMYFAQINSKNILVDIDQSNLTEDEYGSVDVQNIEVSEEIYNNAQQYGSNYYIYSDGQIILNPNYEQEQAQKEAERIGNLTMTALDFITFLRQCGLTLEQIRAYLDSNIELDTQLKYCQNVYCKVARSVMPITVGNITITAEMVENAFKVKNGEL